MKIDKLSVVVGAAIIIIVGGIIIMQILKVGPLAPTLSSVPTPTSTQTLPGTTNTQVTPSNTGPANPSANIVVSSPSSNSSVSVPFEVKGSARVFENVVNYRLLDSAGNQILEGNVIASAPDAGQFGDFTFTISGVSVKGKATLQVFDYSAKDGSVIDKVTIPLVLK